MGLDHGTPLTFYRDTEVRVEIVDDRRVKLVSVPDSRYSGLICDGQPRSLTNILKFLGPIHGNVSNPTRRWLVEDGRLLKQLYDETYGPRR